MANFQKAGFKPYLKDYNLATKKNNENNNQVCKVWHILLKVAFQMCNFNTFKAFKKVYFYNLQIICTHQHINNINNNNKKNHNVL